MERIMALFMTLPQNHWTSPTLDTDKYTFGHPTYNSWCLAKLLLSSIPDDFSTLIIGRIDQTLWNDGPLLLWTICQNIYRNNIALIENIKAKLRSASLSQFGDDAQKYLTFCRDNLCLILPQMQHPSHIMISLHAFLTPFQHQILHLWRRKYKNAT